MKLKRFAALVLAVILAFAGSAAFAAIDWVAVVTQKSTVYASNSTSSRALGTLDKNQVLALQEIQGGWAKVQLNGNIGFMNAAALKKSTMSMYVKSATLPIYASNSASSRIIATFVYGDKVSVEAVSGSWARIVSGRNTGFCSYAALTSANPNNMNLTVYTQANGVKVYSAPTSASRGIGTLPAGTKLACTAVTGNNWCRVSNGSAVGFVEKKHLGTSAPAAASEITTVYVQKDNVPVYNEASASSKVIGTVNAGTKLLCGKISGSWCYISNGSAVGYIQKSLLGTSAPSGLNTMKVTVYVQKDGVKVYSDSSTSAKALATVNRNTKVTCVAVNNGWCRVKSGSSYGYIQQSYLATSKHDGYSTASPAPGKSVSADWWTSGISSKFAKKEKAVVTDVATGISFVVYRGGGTNHADVQPLTKQDTAALKKACGSDFGTWERRAIWVSVDGVKYAASMNCMPHGDGSISNNDYNGHFCIHFTNSRTHGTNSVCDLHQAAIKKALRAG